MRKAYPLAAVQGAASCRFPRVRLVVSVQWKPRPCRDRTANRYLTYSLLTATFVAAIGTGCSLASGCTTEARSVAIGTFSTGGDVAHAFLSSADLLDAVRCASSRRSLHRFVFGACCIVSTISRPAPGTFRVVTAKCVNGLRR